MLFQVVSSVDRLGALSCEFSLFKVQKRADALSEVIENSRYSQQVNFLNFPKCKCFSIDCKFTFILYLSWKGSNFSSHPWLLKMKILYIKNEHGYDEVFSIFLDILPSTSSTGRYIRNSCFFYSLFCNK